VTTHAISILEEVEENRRDGESLYATARRMILVEVLAKHDWNQRLASEYIGVKQPVVSRDASIFGLQSYKPKYRRSS